MNVYIEYKTATLIDQSEGTYTVEYSEKGETIRRTVKYEPIPVEEGQKFPEWISYKEEPYKFDLTIYSWLKDGKLILHGKYKGQRPDREEIVRLEEAIATSCPKPDILSEDEIQEALDEIDSEARPLEKQMKELQSKLNEIRAKKQPVRKKCWHKWTMTEERETGKNWLGTGIEKDYECEICGETQTTYATRL